jgi:hypothetical protein
MNLVTTKVAATHKLLFKIPASGIIKSFQYHVQNHTSINKGSIELVITRICSELLRQWKKISLRWQHISWLKASAFPLCKKNFSR